MTLKSERAKLVGCLLVNYSALPFQLGLLCIHKAGRCSNKSGSYSTTGECHLLVYTALKPVINHSVKV